MSAELSSPFSGDDEDCPFCEIVAGRTNTEVLHVWQEKVVAFRPLNPVVPDHLLVVPYLHVRDATEIPEVAGWTMEAATEIGRWMGPCNIITSVGAEASQTVFHLHLHIVPRSTGDGLKLPWSPTGGDD